MPGDLKRGDIVQVDPIAGPDGWKECLLVVSEAHSWGIVAYARVPGQDGVAYIRLAREQFEPVAAKAIWVE